MIECTNDEGPTHDPRQNYSVIQANSMTISLSHHCHKTRNFISLCICVVVKSKCTSSGRPVARTHFSHSACPKLGAHHGHAHLSAGLGHFQHIPHLAVAPVSMHPKEWPGCIPSITCTFLLVFLHDVWIYFHSFI